MGSQVPGSFWYGWGCGHHRQIIGVGGVEVCGVGVIGYEEAEQDPESRPREPWRDGGDPEGAGGGVPGGLPEREEDSGAFASEREAHRKELRVMEKRNLQLLEFSHGPEDGYT